MILLSTTDVTHSYILHFNDATGIFCFNDRISSTGHDSIQLNMSAFFTHTLILGQHGTGTLIYQPIFKLFL